MIASIACFAVNAVLNHLFVVVFQMGTFGLGLSSSLSLWVFLGIQGRSEWKFSLRSCRWTDAWQIMRLGYPGALSRFLEVFRCIVVNLLVLKYVGSVGLSAFAASNSLLAIIWAYYAGLCMEKMAGNVVLHGFTKDKKKHSLDIRVSHTGDDIILRLRDNCISFNPAERAGSGETEDGIKDIGIRLTYHIAKEFQYQNLLGLNVLVMRI
ncbi:MAG: hypothetical protein K6A77_10180 [Clostridiales bacterium]|nr:hypothetical protein [Clostridiales bacterium]